MMSTAFDDAQLREQLEGLGAWVEERAKITDASAASGSGEGVGTGRECVAPGAIIGAAGARGLLTHDTGSDREGITASSLILRELGGRCMTSAFSLWAHRMVIEYLRHAPEDAAELQRIRTDLVNGDAIGVTAFAAALQAAAGVGALTVFGSRADDGGLVLNGKVAWASNLVGSAYVAVPVAVGEDVKSVALIDLDSPGLTVRHVPELMALSSTSSGMLTLDGVRVPAARIISEDLGSFLPQTRPILLLLQASFTVGLARRCIDEAAALVDQRGEFFRADVEAHRARLDDVVGRLDAAVVDPDALSPVDLVTLRLDAAHLAGDAAGLEHMLRGGAGYVRASGTNRRLREALFLPVQSPSEVQLRQELAALRV